MVTSNHFMREVLTKKYIEERIHIGLLFFFFFFPLIPMLTTAHYILILSIQNTEITAVYAVHITLETINYINCG